MTADQLIVHLHVMADRMGRLLSERSASVDNLPYVLFPFETATGERLCLRVAVEVADLPLHTDRNVQ